ncbi:hypothetical protein GGI35DRAFT_480810 [Trichoderma velutinum]
MRSLIALAFSAVGAQVASGSILTAPIPGYKVVTLKYEVQAFPGGPKMNMTGTIEEVRSELLKINPNLDKDFNFHLEAETTSADIEKRFGPDCSVHSAYGWLPADVSPINTGISYLRGVSGVPVEGPGPGACGRVSCSNDGAIWWCNDNTSSFSLPSFSTIADCAQVIVNACTIGYDVLGQNFNGYNWNCIVREDDC